MLHTLWKNLELDADSGAMSWEQFHESAKTGHYDMALPNQVVLDEMANLYESLPYKNAVPIALPSTLAPITGKLSDIMQRRATPRECRPVPLDLIQLRTLLHLAYGETRDNKDNPYAPRPFRTVPSGGALYPLELYFHNGGQVEGLAVGLYHYSPTLNAVHLLKPGSHATHIAAGLVEFQSHLADNLSLVIFITGMFQRSIFKYRNKGYRFTLFEAGHVAQNLNLAATGLGLGVINIGGFYDRAIDELLGIDGINHSILYMTGICKGDAA